MSYRKRLWIGPCGEREELHLSGHVNQINAIVDLMKVLVDTAASVDLQARVVTKDDKRRTLLQSLTEMVQGDCAHSNQK